MSCHVITIVKVVSISRNQHASSSTSSAGATDLLASEGECAAPDGAKVTLMVGRTCRALCGFASRTSVAIGGLRRLGRGPLAAFLGEDIVQADVEMGVGDWNLFKVFDELGGHHW